MDGLKPAGSRASDVRKNIIEEKNALSGYSNRFNGNLGIGLSRADLYDRNISLKMSHKIAEVPGPVQMACPIAVGESILRNVRSHLGERAGNARHFANKDGIHPTKKVRVRDIDFLNEIPNDVDNRPSHGACDSGSGSAS
jgi:hypothetical protein